MLNKIVAGYGNRVVIRHADLEVFPGEVIGVIGSNGSGKSTLLRAILGLAHCFDGDVILCGRRLNVLSSDQRVRMGVRILVQDHRLFRTLTLADNLLLSAVALEPERKYFNEAATQPGPSHMNRVARMQSMLESTGPKFTYRAPGAIAEVSRHALRSLR